MDMRSQISMRSGAPRWIAVVAVAASLLGLGSPEAFGQGEIYLSNRLPPWMDDPPVFYADGSRIGPEGGYKAQLYVGPKGATVDELMPLLPTTVFRSPPLTPGYVSPVLVVTPYGYGAPVEAVLRVYNGASWETSTCRGESQVLSLGPAILLRQLRAGADRRGAGTAGNLFAGRPAACSSQSRGDVTAAFCRGTATGQGGRDAGVRRRRDVRGGSPRPAGWPTGDRRDESASRRG